MTPFAVSEDKTDEKMEYKTVTGAVVFVNGQSIGVEYSRTAKGSYEMILPVSQETQLDHLISLSEIKVGDTIAAKYRQTYKENDKGERIVLNTTATTIALVRRAPEQALSSREDASK